MTVYYGSLVGTPTQNTIPPQLSDMAYSRTNQEILIRDTVTLAAAAIGSQIWAGLMGWESVLDPFDCLISNAALGASTTFSFGDGSASYYNGLDSAVSTSSAAQKQLLSAVSIGNYFQPLWANLGYASLAAAVATAPQCALFFQIGGAAATGVVTWRLAGARRI
jgi:hypothetical protein